VGTWIAAALVVACLGLAVLPRREVRGRGLALLRCFFPSWRFFEDVAAGPTLQLSTAAPGESFGPWRDAWVSAPRTAASLIVNARGNLELAYQSLVDQLSSELEDGEGTDPTSSITYRLVQHLIERECLMPAERLPGLRYRFRLSADAFTSAEHIVEAP
jgi:hypothetical protein